MPKRKKIEKRIDNITQAKQIIKSKPWEFGLGVIALFGLVGLFIYLSLVYYPKAEKQVTFKPAPSPAKAASEKSLKREYVLQTGESLWQVAEREYGNPNLYPTIVELNKLESPDAVEPGMKIRIR